MSVSQSARRAGALLFVGLSSAMLAAVLALACGGSGSSTSASPSLPAPPQCDPSLWNYVYDPTRLTVMSACQTVTGTIVNQHASDDGDVDMEFALDPPYANLLNAGNVSKLSGNLNIEAICQGPVHPDIPAAAPACRAFPKLLTLPPVGTHVQVTGTYVLDTNHGWMEIHPISLIDVR
jgi:hypothetical protein